MSATNSSVDLYVNLRRERRRLDDLDEQIVQLLYRRMAITDRIMAEKRALGVSHTDPDRERAQEIEYRVWGKMLSLNEDFLVKLFALIRTEAKRRGFS